MLKIVMAAATLVAGTAGLARAELLAHTGNRYALQAVRTNASEAHKTANDFARQVGEVLKRTYPSKVSKPQVRLWITTSSKGETEYHLLWSCIITKTTPRHADFHFDRRGTMRPGETLAVAHANTVREPEQSQKVHELLQGFRGAHIPRGFVQDAYAHPPHDGYWALHEIFAVAPK